MRASEAAGVRVEDCAESLCGHRVLHLVGKGNKPAPADHRSSPAGPGGVPRRARTSGPLSLRPLTGSPIDGRDAYRMVTKMAKAAGIPRVDEAEALILRAASGQLDVPEISAC